jgi:anti-anti-sigma factor
MEVRESSLSGAPRLKVIGDVDHESAPALEQSIHAVLGTTDGVHLLLDLEECPYVDSGGLSVLLRTLRPVEDRGGWVGVISPGTDLRRLFEIVGLHAARGFRVFSSPEEAEAAVEK